MTTLTTEAARSSIALADHDLRDLHAAVDLPALRVTGAGQRVPLVDGSWVRSVHLDNAASTPALEAVAEHLTDVLPLYASVHRGAGYASQVCTALYEEARSTLAAFVGARPDDVVVFTRNTTDALTLLSQAVPGPVVVLDIEHHANLLPWRSGDVRVVTAGADLHATTEALSAALGERPTALLAVTGASNVTGEVPDLADLAALAHAHGARIAVDGAQLLPHRAVDLTASDLDYFALSGHKLYAPFGAGALVGRRDWLDQAAPHQPGGGAVRAVTTTGVTWAESPERHEGGTPAVLGVVALAAACRALTSAGRDRLERHERALQRHLLDGLEARGLRTLRIWNDPVDVVGVVSFTVPGWSSAQVAAFLSAEHGIAVRDGRFCAHPLADRLGVADGAVRASLGVGNAASDVDRLLAALDQLLTTGPNWRYERVGSAFHPKPDPRPLPDWWPTQISEAGQPTGADAVTRLEQTLPAVQPCGTST